MKSRRDLSRTHNQKTKDLAHSDGGLTENYSDRPKYAVKLGSFAIRWGRGFENSQNVKVPQ